MNIILFMFYRDLLRKVLPTQACWFADEKRLPQLFGWCPHQFSVSKACGLYLGIYHATWTALANHFSAFLQLVIPKLAPHGHTDSLGGTETSRALKPAQAKPQLYPPAGWAEWPSVLRVFLCGQGQKERITLWGRKV